MLKSDGMRAAEARRRAEAALPRKRRPDVDFEKEGQRQRAAEAAKTARLRELRLAKEAADREAALAKPAAPRKRAKAKPAAPIEEPSAG